MIIAVPARPARRSTAWSVRIPRGSRPVRGSSKQDRAGRCQIEPQQIGDLLAAFRDNSCARAPFFSVSSNCSSSRPICRRRRPPDMRRRRIPVLGHVSESNNLGRRECRRISAWRRRLEGPRRAPATWSFAAPWGKIPRWPAGGRFARSVGATSPRIARLRRETNNPATATVSRYVL